MLGTSQSNANEKIYSIDLTSGGGDPGKDAKFAQVTGQMARQYALSFKRTFNTVTKSHEMFAPLTGNGWTCVDPVRYFERVEAYEDGRGKVEWPVELRQSDPARFSGRISHSLPAYVESEFRSKGLKIGPSYSVIELKNLPDPHASPFSGWAAITAGYLPVGRSVRVFDDGHGQVHAGQYAEDCKGVLNPETPEDNDMKNDGVLNDPFEGAVGPVRRQVPLTAAGTAVIRLAAGVLAVIGLILIVGMGALIKTLHPGGSTIVLFVLVLLFGLNALIGGIRIIRTGRPNKWTTRLAIGLVFLIIGSAQTVIFDNGSHARSEGRGKVNLVKMADKMSQDLPRMIDRETRWDSVVAGPGEKLTYNYTLVGYASGDLDRGALSTFLADTKKQSCGLRDIKEALKSGSAMEFQWRGKDGRPIAELRLTADECR